MIESSESTRVPRQIDNSFPMNLPPYILNTETLLNSMTPQYHPHPAPNYRILIPHPRHFRCTVPTISPIATTVSLTFQSAGTQHVPTACTQMWLHHRTRNVNLQRAKNTCRADSKADLPIGQSSAHILVMAPKQGSRAACFAMGVAHLACTHPTLGWLKRAEMIPFPLLSLVTTGSRCIFCTARIWGCEHVPADWLRRNAM